jgi:EAL domain-containing protein (putative c-di-GMP-specific phosphodiesterase class I)
MDTRLRTLLNEADLPLGRIVLELTERTPVTDYEPLLAALAPMRRGGVRIAVDDTGSG